MAGFVIVIVMTILFFWTGFGCIRECARRKEQSNQKATYLSSYLLWVGVICGAVFLVVAWFAVAEPDTGVLPIICFAAFLLLGVALMMGWKNCYIVYDHQGFTQYNILKMQRSFTYDQLTGYRFTQSGGTDLKLYACGKTITVDWMSKNATDFLLQAKAGYARYNNGRELTNRWEEIRKAKKDTDKGSFSAHVHNPSEFLIAFILLLVFWVGISVACCIVGFKPITREDCQLQTVTFCQWQTEKDTLWLCAEGVEIRFKIGGYEEYLSDFQGLTEKCDGGTVFVVWTESYETDDGEPYYHIRELSADGVVYRSMEDSNQYSQEGAWTVLALFGGMLVLFLALAWLTYRIGCNPGKYPKWVVYAFFKKDSISF